MLIVVVFSTFLKMENLCILCKVDMGECNPRQYCGKTRCDNEYLFLAPLDQEDGVVEDAVVQKQEALESLNQKRAAWLVLIKKHESWLYVFQKHEEMYSPLEQSQAEMVLEALNLALTECEAQIITIEES